MVEGVAHSSVPRSRRWLKLAGLTARVAASHAATSLGNLLRSDEADQAAWDRTRRRTGEQIAQTLGQLKGAAMKVGQMASTAFDLLPDQVADALSVLQQGAPPMDFETIAAQIRAELGQGPDEAFAHFEHEPFAAASIGQVHRARLDDDRAVVVKVQYPGVDEALDSDLAMLRLALRAGGLVRVSREDLDRVFAEIRDRLAEELDYENEARNLTTFRELHGRTTPGVVVPKAIPERSRARVLTMSDEPGLSLTDFVASDPPQELRDRVGETLARVLGDQIFRFRLLQTDPNPANYGVRPDGTLALYDFGSVKEISERTLGAYRDTIRAGLERDWDGVEQGLRRLGARNLEGPPVPGDLYPTWRDIFARPFEHEGPYDFGQATLHEEVAAKVPEFMSKNVASFRPPPDLIFMDRAVAGTYANLRLLRARVDVRRLLLELM